MVMCEDGVAAHGVSQHDRGGSIPASSLHFWHDEHMYAQGLVERFHYSRRWPSNVQSVTVAHVDGGLFGNKGDAVGAVVFSIPGTRWRHPVWELSRLVRGDAKIVLSALVAAGVRRCRRQGAHLLVSFADATQGHHGGIYQACGWAYNGKRDAGMDGVVVGGVFVPGRSANSRWGTRSPERLAGKGVTATAHYDDGKHLYWKSLTKTGAEWADALELKRVAYPKPTADGA